MAVINRVADFHADMILWRRSLHQRPELGYEEIWTSAFIADKLASFGIEVHKGLAGTGIVGVLEGASGHSKRAIGLRADMDGLPIEEKGTHAHKSQNHGTMHACGHDGHMTMLLGAARYLAETRHFDGTVYFIFQPAEEGGAGARRMMDEGLFDIFKAESVWGMHNWPGLAEGHVAVRSGACMASADHFEIVVTGTGSHAAMPHLAVDPVLASAQIIQSLQSIISRHVNPLDAAVVSVTMIHGGTAFNVIPDEVFLSGTARAIQPATRQAVEAKIRHIAKGVAEAHACQVHVEWKGGYPPTINHADAAMRAAAIAGQIVGAQHVHQDLPPSMGAEDFAFMLEEKPGAYIWIGTGEGAMLHNAAYDFNDDILPIGASYWAKLAESELSP